MIDLREILAKMNKEQLEQYLEYSAKYCENHECEKCKRYLLKFKEKVLDGSV